MDDPKQSKKEGELFEKVEDLGDRSQYHNLVDILFVLDATGSMSWCISQLKQTVLAIMAKFKTKQYNIKFAIELYRDHPPQEYSYVQKHFDLRNQTQILKIIQNQCQVAGGGDTPEAVFDGLVNGLKKTTWRTSTDNITKSKRFLFHGCDAPPHGKEYGTNSSDAKWTQNGCPCGYTRNDVKNLLEQNSVDYSLIKCGNSVDIMAGLFKQCFSKRFKSELEIKNEGNNPLSYPPASSKMSMMSPPSMLFGRPERTSDRPQTRSGMGFASSFASFSKPMSCTTSSRPVQASMPSSSSSSKKAFNTLFGISSPKTQSIKIQSQESNKKSSKMASLVLAEVEKGIGQYFD